MSKVSYFGFYVVERKSANANRVFKVVGLAEGRGLVVKEEGVPASDDLFVITYDQMGERLPSGDFKRWLTKTP